MDVDLKAKLNAALEECKRTVGPVVPCYDSAYLAARRKYHKLLIEAGELDPKFFEPEPPVLERA